MRNEPITTTRNVPVRRRAVTLLACLTAADGSPRQRNPSIGEMGRIGKNHGSQRVMMRQDVAGTLSLNTCAGCVHVSRSLCAWVPARKKALLLRLSNALLAIEARASDTMTSAGPPAAQHHPDGARWPGPGHVDISGAVPARHALSFPEHSSCYPPDRNGGQFVRPAVGSRTCTLVPVTSPALIDKCIRQDQRDPRRTPESRLAGTKPSPDRSCPDRACVFGNGADECISVLPANSSEPVLVRRKGNARICIRGSQRRIDEQASDRRQAARLRSRNGR